MIKLIPFFLLFTIPLPFGAPLLGVPVWVWTSLAATLVFAILLVTAIEWHWNDFSGDGRE